MNTPNYNRAEPLAATAMTRPVGLASYVRHMSWGAVFAGMVIAVVLQLVLSLIGTAIGLSTLDPLRYNGSPDPSSFGIGAAIWWVVTSIAALYAGGWVAGHLAGSPEKTDSMLHGLLAWGLATILTVYLLASMIGSAISGGASAVGATARMAGNGVAAAAGPVADMAQRQFESSGISLDDIKMQARQLLAQTGVPGLQPAAVADQASAAAERLTSAPASPGSNVDDIQRAIEKIVASGSSTVEKVDRDALVNVVMARANLSQAEAEQRVDGWIKSYEEARATFERKMAQATAKAKEVADAAAKASAQAALAAAVALILGAVAAALGGASARRQDELVADSVRRPV